MEPITADDVFERSRFFLNDNDGAIFNNGVLLKPLNIAIDDLREELQNYDISVTSETSAAITIPAGTTVLGGEGGPAFPNDLLVPIACWEKTSGSAMDYALMRKVNFLPKYATVTAFLIYWAYQRQVIRFLGATSDIDVKLDYRSSVIRLAETKDSTINVKEAISFLSARTAALAAEFIGENESRAISLNGKATEAMDRLLNLDIKNSQNQVNRRRPFMASFKARRSWR